jgi:hypothetical protein
LGVHVGNGLCTQPHQHIANFIGALGSGIDFDLDPGHGNTSGYKKEGYSNTRQSTD